MTLPQGIKRWKLPGDKKSVAIILLFLWVFFVVYAYFTDCNAGGGDNYAHYNIARWAFRYPHLFFDMWGKPVFTLLTSPFALLGFYWVRVFNITCGLLTAWLGFLTVRRWNSRYAFLAPAFILFTPLYFVMLFSGMTEILFSLLLMLSIYLFFRDFHILSAIAVSFLYFVRAEGILMIPLFLFALLLKKRYKAIPFLLTGVLSYSLAGLLYYYHDFFWLFRNIPYTGGEGGHYGRGTWYHFFQTMPEYMGYAGIVMLIAGTLSLLIEFIRNGWRLKSESFFIILTVCGPFYGYFFAHAVLWMIGEVSLGLTRVMAGVLPLAGILGVRGFRFFADLLPRERWKLAMALLVILLTVVPGVTRYRSEFRGHPENEVFKKVAAWMRKSGNDRVKIVTHNGYLPFILGMDPWDLQKIQYSFSDPVHAGKGLPDSSLVVWDAHLSPNEGQLPLDLLMKNPDFELVRIFNPEVPFKVLGNNDFKIYVFRKIKNIASPNYMLEKKLELEGGNGIQFKRERVAFALPARSGQRE